MADGGKSSDTTLLAIGGLARGQYARSSFAATPIQRAVLILQEAAADPQARAGGEILDPVATVV